MREQQLPRKSRGQSAWKGVNWGKNIRRRRRRGRQAPGQVKTSWPQDGFYSKCERKTLVGFELRSHET